jgi:TPR repeat protein
MKKIVRMLFCLAWTTAFGESTKKEAQNTVKNVEKQALLGPKSESWSRERLLSELAGKGDISAISELSSAYYWGNRPGISKDMVKAFFWSKALADKDIPEGWNTMGWLLKNGWGCTKSYEQAAYAFEKAMTSPLADKLPMPVYMPLLHLSALYYGGKGVHKSIEKSFDFFQRFAHKNPQACVLLELLELIEQEGNLSYFLLKTLSERAIRAEDHPMDRPLPEEALSLARIEKAFSYFKKVLDKGEKMENKLLQMISKWYPAHPAHAGLGSFCKILEECYDILGKPIP